MGTLRTIALALLVAVGLMAVPAPANAAVVPYSYVAGAGATKVRAVGMTVSSDPTSASGIAGSEVPKQASNTAASANVQGLVSTGALTSSVQSIPFGDGLRIGTSAKTVGLNLLGGAIRADALETKSLTTAVTGRRVGAVVTDFVNLRIAGVDLPVNIGKNTHVHIPGVATVVLNAQFVENNSDGILTQGYAMLVRLLGPVGGFDAGTTIHVNPTFVAIAEADPTKGPVLAGTAYGTQALANAGGGSVTVESGPTARVTMPPSGTGGETLRNATAAVKIPGILSTGAVESKYSGVRTETAGEATTSNEIVGLNLLNGLITADVIKVESHSTMVDGVYTGTLTPTFVNLKIAGAEIPVDVGPNTTINVANLGRVVVNHQVRSGNTVAIRGLRIIVDTSSIGLPVGSVIEVAVAGTQIRR